MQLEIQHISSYKYNQPIFLEPQHLYFKPLFRSYLNLKSFEVSINPAPDGHTERLDVENNAYRQVWFNAMISSFEIEAKISVEISPLNPWDFLVEPSSKTQHGAAKNVYLEKLDLPDSITAWVNAMAIQDGENTPALFANLCAAIHDGWDHQARYDETLHSPDRCFDAKEGSCRDLSWMLIQMLRYLEIPCRFVSGYSFNPELGEGHELHAWVEAYVEGGGWIGLDPSSGLLATEYYIPIAVSYHPANTLPVQGTYRGISQSVLETSVKINLLD